MELNKTKLMTSIEWLIEEMINKGYFKESVTLTNIDHLQYKAEEMHKQEIIDALNEKSDETLSDEFCNNYYQETFVSKGSDATSEFDKPFMDFAKQYFKPKK